MGGVLCARHYVFAYDYVYGGDYRPNVVYSQYGADMGWLWERLMYQKNSAKTSLSQRTI
jgi:hypothetical protein